MKIVIVYDNTIIPGEVILDIIGDKGFGQAVVKRRHLEDFYREAIVQIFPDMSWYCINTRYDLEKLMDHMTAYEDEEMRILHCFSNFIISDLTKVSYVYKKLMYVHECMKIVQDRNLAALMFPDVREYIKYAKGHFRTEDMEEKLEADGLICIGEIHAFIQCITGHFDSRYFNSLQGDAYRLKKISTNKKKIKSEYTYYHLLPEDMKPWFVMPFHYKEDQKTASYEMERLYMTDVAVQWVHGSIKLTEFAELLDIYFHFFHARKEKSVTEQTYQQINHSLYVAKVQERVECLEKMPDYQKMQNFLKNSRDIGSLKEVLSWYLRLKNKVESRCVQPFVSVIGHGDPCFANTLYNRPTRTFKFIDPKGALCEEELWTNPYYDLAKLSHSVCGRYDFFNHALFDIEISEEFEYRLRIPFDNEEYIRIFQEKSQQNGYDFWCIRLYEASLFLSMLPLHMDDPYKVFAFILNAVAILKEIEKHV